MKSFIIFIIFYTEIFMSFCVRDVVESFYAVRCRDVPGMQLIQGK
jgi:hypothetical protein